jgi:hypothetical protein
MQLSPFEYFTIVRQIEDPLDGATYYPQAEIRNARTDALLATIDLDNKGDGRYSERWQVPADTSGLGFYVSIISKIYTDANHTEESPNYGRKEQTFLVKDRVEPRVGGSGPSVNDIREALKKVLAEFDFPTPSNLDLAPLVKAIKAVPLQVAQRIEIPEVVIPEQKELDLNPVLSAINASNQAVLKAIADVKIPDYTNTLRTIQELVRTVDNNLSKADIKGAIALLPELNAEIAKIPSHIEKVVGIEKSLQEQVLISKAILGESVGKSQPENKIKIPSRIASTFNKIKS